MNQKVTSMVRFSTFPECFLTTKFLISPHDSYMNVPGFVRTVMVNIDTIYILHNTI